MIGSPSAVRAVLVLAVAALAVVACGGDPSPGPRDARDGPRAPAGDEGWEGRLRAHLEDLAANDRWQGSLALTRGGAPLFAHGVGALGPADAAPVGPGTRFRVGSVTKTFTATLVFRRVEAGDLSLDTPLADFFPAIPGADETTLAMLLAHRSGLFNLTDDPTYPEWSGRPATDEALVERIAAYDRRFPPGARTEYSNTNYVLLGLILERVTGRSYAALVADEIADPLGLDRTGVGWDTPGADDARPLVWQGRWVAGPDTDPSVPGAAGAVVSTPLELCAFAHALFSGALVSDASLGAMTTVEDGVGRGLFPIPFADRRGWGHGGGIDGFATMLVYFPDDGTCLAHAGHAVNHDTNAISIAALSLLYGVPWTAPSLEPPPALPAGVLEARVGTYVSDALPLDLELTLRDGQLWGQATGQSAFPLTPTSATEMTFTPADVRLVFPPQEGPAPGFTLHQAGARYPFVRAE